MEIIEYNTRNKNIVKQIKHASLEAKPEDCFTCLKCTSGCPANKKFENFAPHKFQIAAYMGMIEDLIESGILWNCFNCITCEVRCPMTTSPAQTICSLTNMAVEEGRAPPKIFLDMINAIITNGAIIKPREIQTTDFEFVSRDDLDLPPRGLKNNKAFQDALRELTVFKLFEKKVVEEQK